MAEGRRLIVNADDFGMSPGVNRGIIEAHDTGIVTSTSLMVRWPDAPEAAKLALARPDLSVGLHVDLGEWVWGDEGRYALYEVAQPADSQAVAAEVDRQLATFRELMGVGPTHLDSHQHIHRESAAGPILEALAEDLGIPLRLNSREVRFIDTFYGQVGKGDPAPEFITVESLIRVFESLPEGTSELMCHPGYGEGLATPYRDERVVELRTLCDPRVRDAVFAQGIDLISFRDVVQR